MTTSPIPVDQYFTLSNGMRIHYTEAGKPSAERPSIVCIHGGGPGASGYSNYKKNIPYFESHGYHVLAPDLPGFGLSDKPENIDYITNLHVQAIRELVTALGLSAVVPIGNSLGGSVALEYTFAYPNTVPSLILMAPGGLVDPATFWGTTEGGSALAKFAQLENKTEAEFRQVMSLLVHDQKFIDDEIVAERFPLALMQPTRVFTSVVIQPTWTKLDKIECPILCFWGANDRFLPVEQALILAKEAARVKTVISNQAGHWYMLEQADDFNCEVIDFLKTP